MTPLDELERLLHAALAVGDTEQAAALSAELDKAAPGGNFPILGAALYYAEQGLQVFPLAPRSKIPHKGTKGCLDATSDEATIRMMWDRWPDSNLAVATGHLIDVVDIDGPAGHASRAQNWAAFQSLNILGMVSTPRPGGIHLYVAANPGARNGAGRWDGVDYRGQSGYVVVPPSVTDVGTYRWLRPLVLP